MILVIGRADGSPHLCARRQVIGRKCVRPIGRDTILVVLTREVGLMLPLVL